MVIIISNVKFMFPAIQPCFFSLMWEIFISDKYFITLIFLSKVLSCDSTCEIYGRKNVFLL